MSQRPQQNIQHSPGHDAHASHDVQTGSAASRTRAAVLTTLDAAPPYSESMPLNVQTLRLDPPGPDELLVRIDAASICHSDLSVVNGSRPRPVPMALGHEASGIVQATGSGVEIVPGTRVVMTFLPRCGQCRACHTDGRLPCSNGSAANEQGTLLNGTSRLSNADGVVNHHLGVSGFATHAVVDRRSVVPVGDDVPAEVAALLGCAVLTGGGALLNAAPQITPETTVAVVGLGGVGMAGLITARALNPGQLIAVDSLESKHQLALELGADEALPPERALDAGAKADVVLEAVGHPRAFETAYQLLGLGGTLVTVGLPAPGATAQIEPLALTAGARTVVGSYLGSAVPARDVPKFEQQWREGRLPVEKLISGHLRLEQINEGMDALANGSALRQIITFD